MIFACTSHYGTVFSNSSKLKNKILKFCLKYSVCLLICLNLINWKVLFYSILKTVSLKKYKTSVINHTSWIEISLEIVLHKSFQWFQHISYYLKLTMYNTRTNWTTSGRRTRMLHMMKSSLYFLERFHYVGRIGKMRRLDSSEDLHIFKVW